MATNAELAIAIKAKNQAEKELKAASKSLRDLGDEADKSGGKMGGLGGKLKNLGKIAAVALPAIGGAAAVGLFKIGKSFDEAFDTIAVGTGATGDNLENLKDSFKDVFSSIPTSMGDASKAIADLNTRTGATGETLEEMTKTMLEMTRITGGNLDANITSVTRAMGDWGIAAEDSTGFMDKLFTASQATGIGIDKLAGQMVMFGAPMRQLGFSVDEAAALFGKFEKEGVNAELVMGSMRIALGKMAKDGEPAVETFGRIVEAIKNAGDASEANKIALELFGSRAGPDMAAAIREGRFAVDDLVAMMGDAEGSILDTAESTRSAGENFKILKNQILTALEPAASAVFEFASKVTAWLVGQRDNFAVFAANVRDVAAAIGEMVVAIGSATFDTFVAIWEQIKDPIRLVRDAVRDIVSFIAGAALQAWKDFSSFLTDTLIPAIEDLAGWISGGLQTAWAWIIDTAIPSTTKLAEDMVTAFEKITGIDFGELSQQIEDLGSAADDFDMADFNAAWEKFKDLAQPLADEIMPVLRDMVGDLGQLFTDVKDALGPLMDELEPLIALWVDMNLEFSKLIPIIKIVFLPLLVGLWLAWQVVRLELMLVIDVIRIALVGAIMLLTANLQVINWTIENVVKPTITALGDAFDATAGFVTSVIDSLGGFSGAFATALSLPITLLNTMLSVANLIIAAINKIIGLVPGIPSLPSIPKVPGIGLPSIPGLPGIPGLAHGGIVTSPTLALIGESGPEAVIPLSRMGGVHLTINTLDAASFEDFLARGGMDAIRREMRLTIA